MQAAADGDFTSVRGSEDLTSEQVVLERVMLGLRTSDGVDADFLRTHCDASALASALAAGDLVPVDIASDNLVPVAIASGNIVPVGTRFRIPESRFFVSDAIISELV